MPSGSKDRSTRRPLGKWSFWLFPLLVAATGLARAALVEYRLGTLTGCHGCHVIPTLKHDALVLGALLILLYLSGRSRLAAPRLFLQLAIVLAFVVYAVDLAVFNGFHLRLVPADVLRYAGAVPSLIGNAFGELLSAFEAVVLLVGALAALLSPVLFFKHFRLFGPRAPRLTLAGALVMVALYLLLPESPYANAWIYQNFVEYNRSLAGQTADYSDEFERAVLSNAEIDLARCTPHAPRAPNILVVIIESLSMYHSELFSGLSDTTPNLDRIARQSVRFRNFYSNSFSSEGALIAILTGRLPVVAPGPLTAFRAGAFTGFSDLEDSLPRVLRKLGYRSEFLTTANIELSGWADWARSIGFDRVEGHDHPYYEDWPRFHYHAAPDDALYARTMDRIAELGHEAPFLLLLETVTTHHPFIEPQTGADDEAGAFAYADPDEARHSSTLATENEVNLVVCLWAP